MIVSKDWRGKLQECTFSQFLSATMGPSVALVSAPRTMPSLKRHPTMVVPVLVALGNGRPFSAKNVFLHVDLVAKSIQIQLLDYLFVFEKSKPGDL